MLHFFLFSVSALLCTPEIPIQPPIPAGSVALEEAGRYRSSRNYQETIDFYRRIFNQTGGVKWYPIVNQPGLRAKHVACLKRKTRWEGINIYEARGEVRIYVLPQLPELENIGISPSNRNTRKR